MWTSGALVGCSDKTIYLKTGFGHLSTDDTPTVRVKGCAQDTDPRYCRYSDTVYSNKVTFSFVEPATGPLDAYFRYSPSSPDIGDTVSFDASGSSGDIAKFRWDFGDNRGATSYSSSTSHTYSAPGSYTVKLTVEDSSGATDTETHTVSVAGAQGDKSCSVSISPSTLKGSGSVSVTLNYQNFDSKAYKASIDCPSSDTPAQTTYSCSGYPLGSCSGSCKYTAGDSEKTYGIQGSVYYDSSNYVNCPKAYLNVKPGPACTSHHEKRCYSGDVYWYDSCGNREEVYEECGSSQTCSNAECISGAGGATTINSCSEAIQVAGEKACEYDGDGDGMIGGSEWLSAQQDYSAGIITENERDAILYMYVNDCQLNCAALTSQCTVKADCCSKDCYWGSGMCRDCTSGRCECTELGAGSRPSNGCYSREVNCQEMTGTSEAVVSIGSISIPEGGTGSVRLNIESFPDPGLERFEVGWSTSSTRLKFDRRVVSVTNIRAVSPYTMVSGPDIDNTRGEAAFTLRTTSPVTSGAIARIDMEAVGSAGESSSLYFSAKPKTTPDVDFSVEPGTVTITQSAVSVDCQISASDTTIEAGNSTIISARYTATSDSVLSVQCGNGQSAAIDCPASENRCSVVCSYPNPGTFTVTGTMGGKTCSNRPTITVSATSTEQNQAPRIERFILPESVNVDEQFTYSFALCDPDGDVATGEIDWGDGTATTGRSSARAGCPDLVRNSLRTYTTAGTFTVTFTARDPQGLTATATRTIRVFGETTTTGPTGQNNAPVANAGPDQNVRVGDSVQLDGSSSSDPDGDTLTYIWSFDLPPGSSLEIPTPRRQSETMSFTPDVEGSYIVTLMVTDTGGLFDTDEAVITASAAPAQQAGAPQASFSASTVVPEVSQQVTFDASASSDPDGQQLSYSWNFGDGSSGSGETTTHTYTQTGLYTVTLTVTDPDSNSDSASLNVRVRSAQQQQQPSGDCQTVLNKQGMPGLVEQYDNDCNGLLDDQEFKNAVADYGRGVITSDELLTLIQFRSIEGCSYTPSSSCQPVTACQPACSGSTPICDSSTGQCVECMDSFDCPGFPPHDCLNNQCVERAGGGTGPGGGGNQRPVAVFTWSPENPQANQRVIFDASGSSDPDGTITLYTWRFVSPNGRAVGCRNNPTCSTQNSRINLTTGFNSEGLWTVGLRVTDDEGATGSFADGVCVGDPANCRETECGDGAITGDEQCDPEADPIGCEGNQVCNDECQCVEWGSGSPEPIDCSQHRVQGCSCQRNTPGQRCEQGYTCCDAETGGSISQGEEGICIFTAQYPCPGQLPDCSERRTEGCACQRHTQGRQCDPGFNCCNATTGGRLNDGEFGVCLTGTCSARYNPGTAGKCDEECRNRGFGSGTCASEWGTTNFEQCPTGYSRLTHPEPGGLCPGAFMRCCCERIDQTCEERCNRLGYKVSSGKNSKCDIRGCHGDWVNARDPKACSWNQTCCCRGEQPTGDCTITLTPLPHTNDWEYRISVSFPSVPSQYQGKANSLVIRCGSGSSSTYSCALGASGTCNPEPRMSCTYYRDGTYTITALLGNDLTCTAQVTVDIGKQCANRGEECSASLPCCDGQGDCQNGYCGGRPGGGGTTPAECTSGETSSCQTAEGCAGTTTCVNGKWGDCQKSDPNCPAPGGEQACVRLGSPGCPSGETCCHATTHCPLTQGQRGVCVKTGWGTCPGTNCGTTTQKHLECRSGTCTEVSGAGANKDGCTQKGQSCGTQQQTHLECVSGTCTEHQGAGPNKGGCTQKGQSCGTTQQQCAQQGQYCHKKALGFCTNPPCCCGGNWCCDNKCEPVKCSLLNNQISNVQVSISTETPAAGEELVFDASQSTDPDGEIVEYAWNFGDGTTAEGETASHTYTKTGSYTVYSTVKDDVGAGVVKISKVKVVKPGETVAESPNVDEYVLAELQPGWNSIYISSGEDLKFEVLKAACENPVVYGLNKYRELYKVKDVLKAGRAYFVKVDNKCKLVSTIKKVAEIGDIILMKGWNVLNPQKDIPADKLENCRNYMAVGIDDAGKYYKETETLKAGETYLVRVSMPCIVEMS
jgi:PKD repeat protein